MPCNDWLNVRISPHWDGDSIRALTRNFEKKKPLRGAKILFCWCGLKSFFTSNRYKCINSKTTHKLILARFINYQTSPVILFGKLPLMRMNTQKGTKTTFSTYKRYVVHTHPFIWKFPLWELAMLSVNLWHLKMFNISLPVTQLLLHSPRLSQLESPSVFSHLLWMSALFSPLSWNFS